MLFSAHIPPEEATIFLFKDDCYHYYLSVIIQDAYC